MEPARNSPHSSGWRGKVEIRSETLSRKGQSNPGPVHFVRGVLFFGQYALSLYTNGSTIDPKEAGKFDRLRIGRNRVVMRGTVSVPVLSTGIHILFLFGILLLLWPIKEAAVKATRQVGGE